MRLQRGFAGGLAVLAAGWPMLGSAHASGSAPPTPDTIWSSWSVEPLVILGLLLGSWLYGAGFVRLWRRSPRGHPQLGRRGLSFAGGILALVVALGSPLDGLSEALFAAHMVQHLLLLLVAAPLLVLSEPLAPLLWSLPREKRIALAGWARRRHVLASFWHFVNRPLVAWLLSTTILWIWHLPALYDAATENAAIHALEHGCFLASALAFWWVLPRRNRRALSGGAGVLYLFAAGMQSGVLGALMTFAGSAWYSAHTTTTVAWGFTPLEDQQLAGLIMWIPASVIYLVAAAVLFVAWLREMEASDNAATALERTRETARQVPANQSG
jgi:putative membrane protein